MKLTSREVALVALISLTCLLAVAFWRTDVAFAASRAYLQGVDVGKAMGRAGLALEIKDAKINEGVLLATMAAESERMKLLPRPAPDVAASLDSRVTLVQVLLIASFASVVAYWIVFFLLPQRKGDKPGGGDAASDPRPSGDLG